MTASNVEEGEERNSQHRPGRSLQDLGMHKAYPRTMAPDPPPRYTAATNRLISTV
jgi:hypothetical protein